MKEDDEWKKKVAKDDKDVKQVKAIEVVVQNLSPKAKWPIQESIRSLESSSK